MSQTPNKIEKRPPKPKALDHAVPKTVAGRDAKAPAYETAAVAEPKTEIVRGMGSLLDSESVRPIGARKFTPRKTAVPAGSAPSGFLRQAPQQDSQAAPPQGQAFLRPGACPEPAAADEGQNQASDGAQNLASADIQNLASQDIRNLASQDGQLPASQGAGICESEEICLPDAQESEQGDSPAELAMPSRLPKPRPAGQSRSANDRMAKAMVGMALLYASRFEEHVWGPIRFLGKHCLPVAFALLHLCMPFAFAWLAADANETMRQTFLAGGALANLGKLVWLFVASVFVWSLAWIGLNRAWRALRDDVSQYERIGRGFFSPNSKEWDSAKRKR